MRQKTYLMITFMLWIALMSCREEMVSAPSKNHNDIDTTANDTITNDTLTSDSNVFESKFFFGADLSYVNQIQDHGGVYKSNNNPEDPYQIFAVNGTNLVRLRLWHNPSWTKELYGNDEVTLYNDLYDVEKAIRLSKAEGMSVLLDFHYSDNWADPGKQNPPAAWSEIIELSVLKDSVYQYTKNTLTYLKAKDLQPELVQIGNEINCGIFSTATGVFPKSNVCDGNWSAQGEVINAAIKAVREVDSAIQVVLHVADPKNIDWWFSNITSSGKVADFEIIGMSYYTKWHTEIPFDQLGLKIENFISQFKKDVMIVETAYPWNTLNEDDYGNIFGADAAIDGYAISPEGQLNYMIDLTQMIKSAGGAGVIYWEPAWVSSQMKTQWGTGSAWENCAFFDFNGNATEVFEYMTYSYSE